MQKTETNPSGNYHYKMVRYISGVTLIIIGLIIYLDKLRPSSWISWVAISIGTLILLVNAILIRQSRWIIFACLLSGVILGYVFAAGPFINLSIAEEIGVGLFVFSLSWFLIILLLNLIFHQTAWWAVIPAAVFLSLAGYFLFSPLGITDFILYLCIGLGIALIVWGSFSRLFGLIIPGCLLLGIGPGIYIAWGTTGQPNGLVQTGTMLVWFAFGWGLITIFSRLLNNNFIWWPLIPGGILFVVGCGLYIGGNPSESATFVSNTTAVGLMILGFYLILLRRGIRK
jgi:hypothetical protein